MLKSLAQDGQGLAGRRGSIELKYRDKDHYLVKLQRSWEQLVELAEKRCMIAAVLLQTIIGKVSPKARGEQLVKFSEKELSDALQGICF